MGCQHCGSWRLVPKVLVGGPMAGLDNKDGRYVCLDCGRELVPLGFEDEAERKDFTLGKEDGGKGMLHIPIVPVDTWPLFSVPVLDVPLVQVAQVVELEWHEDWHILPGGVPFADYLRATGSSRYGAEEVLLMDLAGMQRARPNFEALKALMKRKYSVWLEMGVREVQDLFDAFTLGAETVLVGSMTCPSERLLKEIIELSDMSVPLLYHAGKVLWGGAGLPAELPGALRQLSDLGYERAAVLDLRRLGGREGYDRELADLALSADIEIVFGGGVHEPDLPELRAKGAVGALLDPYTPVLRDIIRSQATVQEERPLPALERRDVRTGAGPAPDKSAH